MEEVFGGSVECTKNKKREYHETDIDEDNPVRPSTD